MRNSYFIAGAAALSLQLCLVNTGYAENPVCSAAMAPGQCAEAQITAIGKTFGEYKADMARLQNELDSAKAEIKKLNERVSSLESVTTVIDKETKPVRPGGQGCILVHQGDPVPGWQHKGYFGLIQFRPFAAGNSDGFTRGGAFTGDWYWEHEDVFCAK